MKRNLALLIGGYSISTFGTYLSLIVINLFIYQTTGSAFLVGLFFLFRLIPAFFMGNIAGVLADKFNRKHLIIIADLIRALAIFSVIFLRGNIYPLYIIIFVIAVCDRLFQSALGGSIPNIVGKENLLNANSYIGTGRTIALIAGPMAGGLLSAMQVYNTAFCVDAATYLIDAVMVYLISADFQTRTNFVRKSLTIFKGLKEGYSFILARAGLFSIILVRCVDAFGSAALNIGTPVFSNTLKEFSAGICYGLLYAAFGIGEMIGSLYFARTEYIQRKQPEVVIGATILVMGLFFGISMSFPNIYFAMICLLLSGMSEGITAVTYNIFLQKNPDEIRGRVVGTSETSVWTSMGIGMFIVGIVAEKLPIGNTVHIFAGIIVIFCLGHLYFWRKRNLVREVLTSPEEPEFAANS